MNEMHGQRGGGAKVTHKQGGMNKTIEQGEGRRNAQEGEWRSIKMGMEKYTREDGEMHKGGRQISAKKNFT